MKTIILGAGMTGLAAAFKTGAEIYEATDKPGGICRTQRVDGYMFENGGGHWIFGMDYLVGEFFSHFGIDMKTYDKQSGVFFNNIFTGNIQDHIYEMSKTQTGTMKDFLYNRFGKDLCNLFFFPFNAKYTNGLYESVIPENEYKSPIKTSDQYNERFCYPENGLDYAVDAISKDMTIHYNKKVENIFAGLKKIQFTDGSIIEYDRLISTIPLNKLLKFVGYKDEMYPYTTTVVINIGAEKGRRFPKEQWLYVPYSETDMYRIGIYSNVDPMFAPKNKASLYVEMACDEREVDKKFLEKQYAYIVNELMSLEIISKPEVFIPSVVNVAYTYKYPETKLEHDLASLKLMDIESIGRYGSWKFQGIAESINEGLQVPL